MKSVPIFRLSALAVIFLLAVSGSLLKAKDKTLSIAATTTMVADLAESVAGEYATVTGLMGPGVDPHLYKATASDINTLQSADLKTKYSRG